MRLNLGCGNRKTFGWTNIDKMPACNPDQVVDLEQLPWPWANDSATEVMMSHVLEHLGASAGLYLGIIKELYRICSDGATVTIIVPNPRHDFFLHDPTHVRPITVDGLAMFSQEANRKWIAIGAANTPLGIYLGVDFAIQSVKPTLDEPWFGRLKRKEISDADINFALRHYNNVVIEFSIVVKAIKPPGRTSAKTAS
jgi:hypothetical protein